MVIFWGVVLNGRISKYTVEGGYVGVVFDIG
jgi:hypothetical protein